MQIVFIDWLIIIAFAAVTISVGLWFAKRGSTSTNEFFISGRALPWWIAGTSMVATSFAADTPLAVTGIVFAIVSINAAGGVTELRANIENQFGDGQAFNFLPSFDRTCRRTNY